MKVDTVDIRDIHEKLSQLTSNTAHLLGRFDSHIENKAIHQNPPCNSLTVLSNRLWGLGVVAVGGLLTAVWSVFSKGQ